MKLLVSMSSTLGVLTEGRVTISNTLFVEVVEQDAETSRKSGPLGMYLGATKVKILGFEPNKLFSLADQRTAWINSQSVTFAEEVS